MVMAIILFMGAVSGAHLNPAVSIAFAARGDFPWRRVPGYVIVQLLGATLACLLLWALLGKIGMLGATRARPGHQRLAGDAAWSWCSRSASSASILGTASGAQNVGVFGALGVGGYIILAGLWSSPISGASMNPARSVRPRPGVLGLHELLGLRGRADRRGARRRRLRLRPARARRRQERRGRGAGAHRRAQKERGTP